MTEILKKSDNELALTVGNYFLESSIGVSNNDIDESKSIGVKWLSKLPDEFCKHPTVKYIIKTKEKDVVMIFTAFFAATIAMGIFGKETSGIQASLSASAYWAKRGIETLCKDGN